jgi:hypothetical protein
MCRSEDLPHVQRSALKFQHIVMIMPPEKLSHGITQAAKTLQGLLLPLLQDMQRLGPQYQSPDRIKFDFVPGSVPAEEIGGSMSMRCT